jgi:quercetin dioxygenase-like cupin family protein
MKWIFRKDPIRRLQGDSEFPFGALIFIEIISTPVSSEFKFHLKEAPMKRFFLIAVCIVLTGFISANAGAQTSVVSKPILKTTLGDDTTKEVVMILVEFPPGSATGRHTHPGDEYAFILQGTFELSTEGREKRRLSTGDAFHTPRTEIHENRNVGDTPGRVVITLILDKGKPLVQPAGK